MSLLESMRFFSSMKNTVMTTLLIGILLTSITLNASFVDAASCSGDCMAPTLGVTDNGRRVVENGFAINEESFNVESFSQEIPTQVFSTGDTVKIVITGYENSGIDNVRHVTLAIGDVVNNKEANTKVKITTERSFTGQVTQSTADTTGLLDRVMVTSKKIDSFTGAMTISFVVMKPMKTSDIIVRLWDADTNVSINIFNDAIQVVGKKSATLEGETPTGKMTSSTEQATNPKEDKVKKKMDEQKKLKEEKIKKALEKAKNPMTSEGKKKKKLPQQEYP